MRVLASLALVAAAGGAFLSSAPASAALPCPPGTVRDYRPVPGTNAYLNLCWPGVHCDPMACPPVRP